MEKMNMLRKITISSLVLTMMIGGAISALADGKGKYRDNHVKVQVNTNEHMKLQFKDVNEKQLEWALKHITILASKEVFNGYDDGSFLPNKTISRVEAITAAVRLMGLKAQAESKEEMSTELNFKDADRIEKRYPWAVGYIAVAAEKDLFSETEQLIQPDKAADRLWATTLLVKALKLDAEAQAKMNEKLEFKDAHKIPAGSVGYVVVALEKGLIKGYENNTFQPNKPVTRAELAALLGRTDEQMPVADKDAAKGTIVSVQNNVLILKKNDNTEVALILGANVLIFRDGVKVAASVLAAGDTVIARSYNNLVIFLNVTKKAEPASPEFKAEGKINSITLNAKGKLATISIVKEVNGSTEVVIYNVDSDVTIIGNVAKLVANQAVEVKGSGTVVKIIEIK